LRHLSHPERPVGPSPPWSRGLTTLVALASGGCYGGYRARVAPTTVYAQTQYQAQYPAQYGVVYQAPPPPMQTYAPPAPYAGAQWIEGHWEWNGAQYVWVEGYWVQGRPGYVYVQPRWERRSGGLRLRGRRLVGRRRCRRAARLRSQLWGRLRRRHGRRAAPGATGHGRREPWPPAGWRCRRQPGPSLGRRRGRASARARSCGGDTCRTERRRCGGGAAARAGARGRSAGTFGGAAEGAVVISPRGAAGRVVVRPR
jgi:hypothetical protein